jgi:hypothetical protein
LNFGGVTLAASASQPLSIVNRSKVSVMLYLDLSGYPEFKVEFPEEWMELEPQERPFTAVPPGRAARLLSLWDDEDAKLMPGTGSGGAAGSGASAGGAGAAPAAADSKSRAKSVDLSAYQFFVKPESTLSFDIVYTPTAVKTHEFELPLYLSGLPNYAPIRRVVVASGLKPRVTLALPAGPLASAGLPAAAASSSSSTAAAAAAASAPASNSNASAGLDFGKQVVLKKERAWKNAYHQKFTLKNEESSELPWKLALPPSAAGADSILAQVAAAASAAAQVQAQNNSFGVPSTPLYGEQKSAASATGGAAAAAAVPTRRLADSFDDITWRIEPVSGTLLPQQAITVNVLIACSRYRSVLIVVFVARCILLRWNRATSTHPCSSSWAMTPSLSLQVQLISLHDIWSDPLLRFCSIRRQEAAGRAPLQIGGEQTGAGERRRTKALPHHPAHRSV